MEKGRLTVEIVRKLINDAEYAERIINDDAKIDRKASLSGDSSGNSEIKGWCYRMGFAHVHVDDT